MRQADPFDEVCRRTLLLAFFIEEQRLLVRRVFGARSYVAWREMLEIRMQKNRVERVCGRSIVPFCGGRSVM